MQFYRNVILSVTKQLRDCYVFPPIKCYTFVVLPLGIQSVVGTLNLWFEIYLLPIKSCSMTGKGRDSGWSRRSGWSGRPSTCSISTHWPVDTSLFLVRVSTARWGCQVKGNIWLVNWKSHHQRSVVFKTFSLSFNALHQKVSFEDIEKKRKEKGIFLNEFFLCHMNCRGFTALIESVKLLPEFSAMRKVILVIPNSLPNMPLVNDSTDDFVQCS